ncbi:MAG: DUF262 domain-containing protein [Anaerolineales bacterium]|nr:DUF262 domain-containing protein [Anaerolineales bacterium]MCW5855518.1 DUF262 domain-containing protein [Anaerolineales bacterium]
MEARNRQLPDWLTRVRTGQIQLPRFQRLEAWGYREITDLLNAMLRGLPVGSFLILGVGNEIPFQSRTISGVTKVSESTTELLLDGQQRITAIWRALTDDYSDRKYFVSVIPNQEDDTEIMSVNRWERDGKRFPAWADEPRASWERGFIPISLLLPGDVGEKNMDDWVDAAIGNDSTENKNLTNLILKLRQKIATYNLPFLSLPIETPREVALEVFIKMNTRTVRLTTFDIIVAQVEDAVGESLHDLVESLASTVPGLSSYDTPEDIVLGSMALFQDRVPNQTGYLGMDFRKVVNDWPKMVSAAQKAVDFLEQERVFDNSRLPTESILAPLIVAWSHVSNDPDEIGNAQILLRKYLWRSFFTDRYERAAATASLQDYRAIRDYLTGSAPEENIPCLNEAQHPLPTIESIEQAGWPKKRDRLARAVLMVSLIRGALDIADGSQVTRSNVIKREYHHLFPIGFLRQKGYDEQLANRALNCALISWKTNRKVAAKDPIDYLRERADASNLGEKEIERRLKSHSIDFKDLSSSEYKDFLHNRATGMKQIIDALCNGTNANA